MTGWLSQISSLEVSSFHEQMVCYYDQRIWSQRNYPVVKMPLGRTHLLPPSCILFCTFSSYWCGFCKQCGRPYPIACKGKEAVPATFKGNMKKVLFHISTPSCEHSNRGGNKPIMAGLMEVGKEPGIIYCQVTILRPSCKFVIFPQLPSLVTPSVIFNAIQNLEDQQLSRFN